MKLAAVQYRPPKGDPQKARQELGRLVDDAGRQGAELVVCPEMCTTGYIWPDADALRPHAEPARGPTLAHMGGLARRHQMFVSVGFPERAMDPDTGLEQLFNASMLVGPDGQLVACYRKVLLYEADEAWARAGSRRVVVDTELGRVAPAICMDVNASGFPGFLEDAGVAVVAFNTNWVEEGLDVHAYWAWRLGGWSGWFVAGNTWGQDSGTVFSGRSAVLGPGGRVVKALPARGDGVVVVDTGPADGGAPE